MDIRDAMNNARALLHIHGLAQQGWTVKLDNAKTRAGICRYKKKEIGISRLATEFASPDDMRETVLHEIAHALAGWEAAHGPEWRAVYRRIGGTGGRTATASAEHRQAITYKWVGKCAQGHEYRRHKLTKSLRLYGVCSVCRTNRQIVWVDTTLSVR